jgi:hypothetical protein
MNHQGMRGAENLDGWFSPIIIIVFPDDRVKDEGGTEYRFIAAPRPAVAGAPGASTGLGG